MILKMYSPYMFGSLVIAAMSTGIAIYFLKPKKTTSKIPLYKCYFLTECGIRGQEITDLMFNMLKPLIDFVNESKTSLDLCFYIISDVALVNAIIKAKERNVKVRIVTDYSTGIFNNKYAKYFYKQGIFVYSKNLNSSQTIMHNKFVIRDEKVLLQASLNLTKNTSKGSYDNVLVTDDPYMVDPFKEHFEYLVNLFDSDVEDYRRNN